MLRILSCLHGCPSGPVPLFAVPLLCLCRTSTLSLSCQVYEQLFEGRFLSETEDFYAAEGLRFMAMADVPDFLRHVEERLTQVTENAVRHNVPIAQLTAISRCRFTHASLAPKLQLQQHSTLRVEGAFLTWRSFIRSTESGEQRTVHVLRVAVRACVTWQSVGNAGADGAG